MRAWTGRTSSGSWRSSATRSCTTSCCNDLRTPLGTAPVRAGHGPGGADGGPSSWASPRTRARVHTCCASPGTLSATRLALSSPRRPTAPRVRSDPSVHVGNKRRDRAGQPRAAAGRLVAHRPRLRRRPDLVGSARGARAPSNGCASTASTLEPRFRIIGSELWSDEAGFAKTAAELGEAGSAVRASSR